MSPRLYALLERIHGHLALLGLAVLLHPVITLRLRRAASRGTRLTADLGAALLLLPYALGWWIYPTYRERVKPRLFAEAREIALLFETKEHLAWMAAALALSGAVALRAAGGTASGRRTAFTLLLLGWLCGAATGAIGTVVASIAHPAWVSAPGSRNGR